MKSFNWLNRKVLYSFLIVFSVSAIVQWFTDPSVGINIFSMFADGGNVAMLNIYPIATIIASYSRNALLVDILPEKKWRVILKELRPWLIAVIITLGIYVFKSYSAEGMGEVGVGFFLIRVFVGDTVMMLSTISLFVIIVVYKNRYNIKAALFWATCFLIIVSNISKIAANMVNSNDIRNVFVFTIGTSFILLIINMMLILSAYYMIKKYSNSNIDLVITNIKFETKKFIQIIKDKIYIFILFGVILFDIIYLATKSDVLMQILGIVLIVYTLDRFISLLRKSDLYVWITNKRPFIIWRNEFLRICLLWLVYFIPRIIINLSGRTGFNMEYSYLTCLVMCLIYICLFKVYNNSAQEIFNKCMLLIAVGISLSVYSFTFKLESTRSILETGITEGNNIVLNINGALIACFIMIIYKLIKFIWDKIIVESYNMKLEAK